ncbi:MAG: PrsW family intramembrane metalloprotease [Hyphomicrobiales bacterium]|nr:PrsW family intramembrane metalloprotease [Hyphomicrobiales bacterium]
MTAFSLDRDDPLSRHLLRRPRVCMALGVVLVAALALAGLLQLGFIFTMPANITLVFLAALVLSSALSVLPVGVLWYLERRERASAWFFAAAFLWGGFVATALAMPFNTAFFGVVDAWVTHHPVVTQLLGADAAEMLSAPISAPITEEVTKALGVMLIFILLRGEFDSVRDGIVYGALVGAGFNWYETALYVAQGYAQLGTAPFAFELGGRYALLGFSGHALFTGIFGGFLGYALLERRLLLRIAAPIVGLMLACTAHMLNNALPLLATLAEAAAGVAPAPANGPPPDIGFVAALVGSSIREIVIFLPFVMIAALVLWRSDVWERRVIREELRTEPRDVVSAPEYDDIVNDGALRTRRMDRIDARVAAALVDAQNELAFRKRRLRETGGDPTSDPIAARLREQIRRLHAAET